MEYIEKNIDRLIEDITGCISIASVSDDKENVGKALDYVLDLAADMGMRTARALDGQVGIVEIGQGDETLGILTHVDVVDAGNRELWICDPFEGQVIDGKIYGRGAVDDKGPLLTCLHAMKAVMEDGSPFHKKVQMVIGTQEEAEWTDMDAYVAKYPLPDYGFTPDGEFPMCNIEKGGLDAVLRFPVSDSGEKEPEGLHVKEIRGGTAVNIVPGECEAALSDGSIVKANGRAVHSSRPEKGENAILMMADKLLSMDLASNSLLDRVEMIRRRLSDVYGSGIGIYSKSEYFNGEYIHRNVISPTIIRTVDGYLELTINIRYSYESSGEEITEAVKKFCEEEGGTVIHWFLQPAVYVSRDEPFLAVLAEAYEKETPFKNEFSLAYGGSYAKTMKRIVSWGPILPGMEDTCHEENEHIRIEDLITNFRVYHRAILEIAKSQETLMK